MPLAGAILIGLLLISFNKTMNRLSKPVSTFSASCQGVSAVLSYALMRQEFSNPTVKEIIFNLGDKIRVLNIQLGIILDKPGATILAFISTISLLLIILSHQLMYRKKKYVLFFIFLGLFNSSLLYLSVSPMLHSFTGKLSFLG